MPQLPIPPMVARALAVSQGRDPDLDEELALLADEAMDIPEPMRGGMRRIQAPPAGVLSPEQEAADEAMERYLAGGPPPPGMMTARGRPILAEPTPIGERTVYRRTQGGALEPSRTIPTFAGRQAVREQVPEGVLAQLRPEGIGAPPAVLTAGQPGQLGPTPGPLQQGMRRISVSRSGPGRPGELTRILGEAQGLEEERARQAEEFLKPYQEPVATEEGKLIDPEGPGSRRALVDEFQDLAARPDKSQAELSRLGQVRDLLTLDTAEAKAGEQLRVHQELDRKMGEEEQRGRDREQAYFEQVEAETSKLADLQQEFASAEVDPDRLLGSGGKRIMAAIGMALGAMGAALAKTPNFAMKIIGDAIDRDIQAQESNIKKLGTKIGWQQSLLGQMRNTFRDEATASAGARVVLGNAAKRKLDSLNLQYAPAETQNKVTALGAAMEQKTAGDLRDFQQKSFEGAQRSYQLQANIAAQRESLAMRRSQAAGRATAAEGPSAPGGLEVVPGRRPTKKDRDKSSDLMLGYRDVQEALNEARALRAEYGNEWWKVGPAATRGEVVAGHLMLALGKMNGAGANFTEAEMKLMGSPSNILELGWVGARLEQLEDLVNRRTDAKLHVLNFQRQVAHRKARAPGE